MTTRRYLSLNFGDETCASTHYRILAYLPALRNRGIEVEAIAADAFSAWDDLPNYDGVIVQKKLFSLGRLRRIRRSARRLLYDIDDAIWLPQGRVHHWWTRLRTNWRLRAVASQADVCVVANRVIASHLEPFARRVEVLPMVLDESAWPPARERNPSRSEVIVGWSGAPGNLRYLEPLEPALVRLQARYPSLCVRVLCGQKPRWTRVRFEHIPWRPGAEAAEVGEFDIGLLPLEDTPFAAGKSPIKGLQYMASGIPTIATPLAATCELFGESGGALFAGTVEEWERGIESLIENPSNRQARGAAARAHFEARHSLEQGAIFWCKLLSS